MNVVMFGLACALEVIVLACTASAEQSCVTSDCHQKIGKDKFVHSAVTSGDCTTCHESSGKRHPGVKGAFKLAANGAKLCLMCHEDKFSKKDVHPPVASGDCIACHEPHQSAYRWNLRESGAALCYSCHDPSQFSGTSVHEPAIVGDCTACHNPHSTDTPHLLVANMSDALYLPYSSSSYSLCFSCHPADLVRDRRTVTMTSFRDGDRNLHYVHVNNPIKGRSCKVCHSPHASGQQRLIREKVTGFGSWGIPIVYSKTADGGTCLVGCHKPQSYNRNNPVVSQ